MRKLKIGDKVILKPRYARWYLDNPEIYLVTSTGVYDEEYDTDIQLCMMSCFGVPITGTIKGEGTNCWRVEFKQGNLRMSSYIDQKNLWLK